MCILEFSEMVVLYNSFVSEILMLVAKSFSLQKFVENYLVFLSLG